MKMNKKTIFLKDFSTVEVKIQLEMGQEHYLVHDLIGKGKIPE